ncbi:hypothetical protein [Culturomica massiliensis]|uniref:hypothetical protein n=1 Tax=Culturomica massiliensis TaxID=1841857 RepID=UPI0011C477B7|nr:MULTISPECIES: hypothetical protein [Odoribacteraceae]
MRRTVSAVFSPFGSTPAPAMIFSLLSPGFLTKITTIVEWTPGRGLYVATKNSEDPVSDNRHSAYDVAN